MYSLCGGVEAARVTSVSNNQLSGSIPASLSALTKLQDLYLNNNQLSGCYPASLTTWCSIPNKSFSGNSGLPDGGSNAGFAAFCASGGLSSELTVGITANPSLTITQGNSTQLTATGADTYRWSTTSMANPITVSVAGPYSVTGTTTAGCSNTAMTTVIDAGPLLAGTLTATPTTIFTTGSTLLTAAVTGGIPPYSYTFTGPGTIVRNGNTATVSGLSAGLQSFTVVVMDSGFQTLTRTVTVPVSGLPTQILTVMPVATPSAILTTGTTTLSAIAAGGIAPYTYRFSGPGTISPSGNTATVSGLPVGVQSFTVLVIDSDPFLYQKASQVVSVTVTAVPVVVSSLSLTASASPTVLLTSGMTTLSAQASGGTPGSPDRGYTYSFSGPGTISQTGNKATVSGLSVGVQSFTITVRDATSPSNQVLSQVVSVTVNPVPVVVPPPTALSLTASASPTTILTSGSTTLSALASGGTPGYSYSFGGPGTIVQNGNSAIVSGLPVGVQSFTVLVRDAGLPTTQSVSQIVSVTVTPVPVVVTSLSLTASASPTTILTSGSATLSASASGGTAPYSYSFSGPGTISQSGNAATVSGLPVGVQTFTVSVRDATSPTNQLLSQVVSVTVTPVPTVPPVPVPFSATVVSYNCATGELILGSVGSASGGVAVEYAIPGITNFTSTNTFTLNAGLRRDASQLTINVRQGGVSGVSLVFDFRSFCTGGGQPTPTPPAPVPTGGLSATVVSYNCATGALVLGSVGGTGSAVSYAIPGVTNFTPTNTFTLNDGLRRDASQLTINVQQGGVAGTPFVFNLRSFCQSQASARFGSGEPVSGLTVTVLGNPVSGDAVVEIGGAVGQALQLRLVDLAGRLVESRSVAVAAEVERQVFKLNRAVSVLLLQVSGAGQTKMVKLVQE